MQNSRRSFLAAASMAAAGNALGFRPFGMLNALAQTTANYKALVCIFLFGGNDANNMLIPFDATGYGQYATVRGPLSVPQNTLLQLGPQPNFALHPSLPDGDAACPATAAGAVLHLVLDCYWRRREGVPQGPQGLKPSSTVHLSARLKPCPSDSQFGQVG